METLQGAEMRMKDVLAWRAAPAGPDSERAQGAGSDSAFASWSTFNCFSAISLTVNNEEWFLVLPRSGNTHLICGVMIHGSRFQLWNHLLSVEHWLCNKTRNLKVDFHNQNLDQMKLGISAQSELSPGSKLLEMVRNKEAWHVAVHGVTKSQTWLSS